MLYFLIVLIIFICHTGCDKGGEWELVWADEFDYKGKPDETFWGYEKGYVRNNELQYYTDQLHNVKVENGYCF